MQEQAVEFFRQWTIFSERVLKMLDCPVSQSPAGGAAWRSGAPQGAILHWTASDSLSSAVRWFCRKDAQTSAHAVVADRLLPWAKDMHADLPLVAALPATCVQCRPVHLTAAHARSYNDVCYGIENQNVGPLQNRENATSWLNGNQLVAYRSDKPAQKAFGQTYEPYTLAQVQANISLLQYVNAYSGGSLIPTFVLGHSCVQTARAKNGPTEDKLDPGPLFPVHQLRQRVFSPAPLDGHCLDAGWAKSQFVAVARAALVHYYLNNKVASKNMPDPASYVARLSDTSAWSVFVQLVRAPRNLLDRPMSDAVLYTLGYAAGPQYISATGGNASVPVFQKAMGLVADGVVGPKTSGALTDRFAQIFTSS
jgi:N-acetyl-anhydromuramyl-L-alanine amidase AmpD